MYALEMMFCFKVQQHQLTVALALLSFEASVKRIWAAAHFLSFSLVQSESQAQWFGTYFSERSRVEVKSTLLPMLWVKSTSLRKYVNERDKER